MGIILSAIKESLVFGLRHLDRRSLPTWVVDVFHYRLLRILPLGRRRRRTIRLRDGTQLTYEMNRGDVRALAETWLAEAYMLPIGIKRDGIILDVGANIGLTSVWMARVFGCRRLIAVEPVPRNAEIARINVAANSIPGEVIEAAVGTHDGEAFFAETVDSTLGRVSSSGRKVRMISMPSILRRLPNGERVDLLKLDVEGAEGELVSGDISWLDRIDRIVAEIHPGDVDADAFIRRLEAAGFTYRYLESARSRYGGYGPHFVGLFVRT